MAHENDNRPALARAASRLAAATLACCALGVAFIPAATAKRDHEKASTQTTAQTTPGTSTAPATTSTPASTPAPAAASAPAKASKPARADKPARAGASADASAPAGSAGSSQASGSHRAGADREAGEAARPKRATRAQRKAAEGKQASAQAGADAQPGAAAADKAGSAHKKAGARHKEASEPTRSHEVGKRSKAKAAKPPTGSSGAAGDPTLPVAVPTSVPVVPAPAQAPSTPTASSPAVGLAPPSVAVRSPRVPRRPAPARHRAAHQRANAIALASAAALPVAATSAPRASRSRHTPGSGPDRARAHGRSSPLATTITRIVEVVPTAVWALIAGLFALALALAARSSVAALRAGRLERQRGELLEDVGLLQAALLPVAPARLGPVGTSVAYEPAAGPGAGGDFYDLFALQDGQLAVIVGDVSGHGRQALPHTALVRFTLRAYLEAGLSPRDAVQTAGAVLERQLGGVFATVVVATYQPRERVLVYACAGHPPPIVLGSSAGARLLAPVTICTSPPIGVGMRTGTRQTAISLPGAAQICFYTDGVTEARVGAELFGTGRLIDTLTDLGSQATASTVLERVAQRADARPDDMAACLLSVEGGEAAPQVLVEELELNRDEAASDRTACFLRACGLERREVAEVVHSACVAAGRAGTIVLEVRHEDGPPEVAVRREHLAYLHPRRAQAGVPR